MCQRIGRLPIRIMGFGIRLCLLAHPDAEATAEDHDLHLGLRRRTVTDDWLQRGRVSLSSIRAFRPPPQRPGILARREHRRDAGRGRRGSRSHSAVYASWELISWARFHGRITDHIRAGLGDQLRRVDRDAGCPA